MNNFINNKTIISNNTIISDSTKKYATKDKSFNVDSKNSFQDILKNNIESNADLKFSKHAEQRLRVRNIKFDKSQLERINMGIDKANGKGIKESLVLIDNTALVVSVQNNTVITAINNDELKNNVFTNIDGAIIV